MGIMVSCTSCRQMLDVPAELIGHEVRCSLCGQTFTAQTGTAATADEPAGQAAAGPGYGQAMAGLQYGDEVYQPGFDLGRVNPATLNFWRCWRPTSFSVAGAVLLDIFTCGLFGLIYYGIKFGELPKTSRNDFGAGQAIGFMFIPYFSIYWQFRFWLGLCDRVNLQLRLRGGFVPPLSRNLALTICILNVCCIVPYAGIVALLAAMVCREIFIAQVQSAINIIATSPQLPLTQQNDRAGAALDALSAAPPTEPQA